jgi:hypothetical protein
MQSFVFIFPILVASNNISLYGVHLGLLSNVNQFRRTGRFYLNNPNAHI